MQLLYIANNAGNLLFFMFLFHSKGGGTAVQRFDKSLEEFYAICDQVELNLVSIDK